MDKAWYKYNLGLFLDGLLELLQPKKNVNVMKEQMLLHAPHFKLELIIPLKDATSAILWQVGSLALWMLILSL